MKAKEVLEMFRISRNTLCTWVKKGWIGVELTPSGRYVYFLNNKKSVYSENNIKL